MQSRHESENWKGSRPMSEQTDLERRLTTLIIGRMAPTAARAIIDDLGLTIEEGPVEAIEWRDGNYHPVRSRQRIVGKWEKQ